MRELGAGRCPHPPAGELRAGGLHSSAGTGAGGCGRVNPVPDRSFVRCGVPVVLPVIDLRGSDRDPAGVLPRAPAEAVEAARAGARQLVDDVAARGDAAVAEAARRFDGVDTAPAGWRATPDELADAEAALDPELRAALLDAIERARAFHQAQRPDALVTPPGPGGRGHAAILGAAALLGVDEVWLLGGTQAVAALACGTETVPAVDSVTGPGNLYVALAKREVAGRVRTDGFAGPTEVAVLADATADPLLVAVDLVAQAEHDPLAACLLVTDDADLWKAVEPLLAQEVAATAHRDRVEAAFAGQSATVLCDDRAAMLRVAEAFAPEHLELLVADPGGLAAQVRNAGAVFARPGAPVALGDYAAGPNHALPTAGTARFASGLSTLDFLRTMQVATYDRDALAAAAPTVAALSRAEDLPAHGRAVAARLAGQPGEGS